MYRYKIHDKVYDLTDFVPLHPGGTDMFQHLRSGCNITPMLYAYHKSPKNILAMLPKYEIASDSLPLVKFDTNFTYDKYCELKKIVYDEMHEQKIPVYWTAGETLYNISALFVYASTWGYCFYNNNNFSYGWILLLAFMSTTICNLIFHETSHYAGSKNKTLNRCLSYCAYPFMVESNWKFTHNYLHHSFTNTNYDCDYSLPHQLIRHSLQQPHQWFHTYQQAYSSLLFMLFTYHIGINISWKHSKLNWLCFPLLLYYFGFGKTVCWYSLSGFLFTFIAQLSHVQHECIECNTEQKNDFLCNQVVSAMNYRTNDPITRLLCFGLDIQIEHHLFPNIPHSSLRRIQPIVRAYCDKHNIPYVEKSSVFPMLSSYVSYLGSMAKP